MRITITVTEENGFNIEADEEISRLTAVGMLEVAKTLIISNDNSERSVSEEDIKKEIEDNVEQLFKD